MPGKGRPKKVNGGGQRSMVFCKPVQFIQSKAEGMATNRRMNKGFASLEHGLGLIGIKGEDKTEGNVESREGEVERRTGEKR
ncbi:hypothetical protein V6N11_028182 [Hibiscus sabdariffa]|uniref:Uncharacterized protein n=1 Tax=Hibiscus sabdariffa TaxID=183260 RepID=A0ABR2N6N4_9ROSI